MTRSKKVPSVFFNASVILAGLRSPAGGSAKLLFWCQKKKIHGLISQVILEEVKHKLEKLNLKEKQLITIVPIFKIYPAPNISSLQPYEGLIIHTGDVHLLASAKENKADFLVSLDKKHILILKTKIKKPQIVSPKDLIEKLS